jgi:hypothetical protein
MSLNTLLVTGYFVLTSISAVVFYSACIAAKQGDAISEQAQPQRMMGAIEQQVGHRWLPQRSLARPTQS